MNAKEIVTTYYSPEVFNNPEVISRFLHNEFSADWRSSKGFLQLKKEDLIDLMMNLNKAYSSYRLDIGNIIADGSKVCVRYTHYVNAFENPDEEMVLAHFVAVWEVKDKKLYRGYVMSQVD